MTIDTDPHRLEPAARSHVGIASRLSRILDFLRLYFGSIGMAARQFREIRRLEAMSDDDLRKAGLTRERILDHVMNGDDRRR